MGSTTLEKSTKPQESKSSDLERQRKTQLILKQASDALQETHAARRAVDSKIHSLLGLAAGLVGLFAAFRVWASLRPIGQAFFISALVIYASVIALGLVAYYPKSLHIPYPHAILRFQDEATYDELEKWVADDLLTMTIRNAEVIETKSDFLEVMVALVILASAMLVVSGVWR
jgi:predicted acyltransferase